MAEASVKASQALPDLNEYVEKRVQVRMHGNRTVCGVLAGYDHFMNLVLQNSEEVLPDGTTKLMGDTLMRGQSIVNIEMLVQ